MDPAEPRPVCSPALLACVPWDRRPITWPSLSPSHHLRNGENNSCHSYIKYDNRCENALKIIKSKKKPWVVFLKRCKKQERKRRKEREKARETKARKVVLQSREGPQEIGTQITVLELGSNPDSAAKGLQDSGK